jgi:hypothetical protein
MHVRGRHSRFAVRLSCMTIAHPSAPTRISLKWWLLFVALAAVAQATLVTNPGYFSHDELQWAARADAGGLAQAAWAQLGDWRTFQWRPLTFALWMALSRALFATPWAFHAAFVAMGTAIGAGLLRLLVRLGVAPRLAVVAALVFVCGPYASYTHGWVATLADLLWVGAGLLGANRVLAWRDRQGAVGVAVFVLTVLALLAKEAAVVLPALAALAWLTSGRRREWFVATGASAVPVAIYLALRVGVILYAPRAEGVYAWSLAQVPRQWLAYQLFPLEPSILEVGEAFRASTTHLAVAGALVLAMWFAVWRAAPRAAAWGVLGGALALGPVLGLALGSNQYAYAQSAIVVGALAVAWPRLRPAARTLAGFVLLVTLWHGFAVQRELASVGARQARFSPALAAAVQRAGEATIRVRLPREAQDAWIYRRLGHDIPAYAGVPIGTHVVLVENADAAPADYGIEPDGSLRATR